LITVPSAIASFKYPYLAPGRMRLILNATGS